MVKLNDDTIEELISEVNRFEQILRNRENDTASTHRFETIIGDLQAKNRELQAKVSSVEFRSRKELATELDSREANLKATLKLEYDKGYADAYTEVTRKMKS